MQRFSDHNLEAIYIPKTPRKAVLPTNLALQFQLSFEFPIIFNFNFQFSNFQYSKPIPNKIVSNCSVKNMQIAWISAII